jgi:hypothetical protein
MKAIMKTVLCLTLGLAACDGQSDDVAAAAAGAARDTNTSSADGRDAFVATWHAMSSDMTTTCADNVAEANATITSLTWTKGAGGELVAAGASGSCPLTAQVMGSTASAADGQRCATSDGAYGFNIVERDGFTFVLGADGQSASVESSGTVVYDEGGTIVMSCSYRDSATYQKASR